MTIRFGATVQVFAMGLLVVLFASCGRTRAPDAGPKTDGSASSVADGAVDTPTGQADDATADTQGESQTAVSDDAPSGLDAGLTAAIDAVARDTTAPIEAAPLDARTDTWPTAVPSRQTVRFTVQSQRMGWAVTRADVCSALAIDRQNPDGTWQSLVLGIPYQCGCECPAPPDSADLQSLSSAATVTWDAREVVVATETVRCQVTSSQTQNTSVLRAIPQPVAPGHYRAALAIDDAIPVGCSERADTGRASCGNFSDKEPMYRFFDYKACPGDRTARAEFDLPSSGDLDVSLLI